MRLNSESTFAYSIVVGGCIELIAFWAWSRRQERQRRNEAAQKQLEAKDFYNRNKEKLDRERSEDEEAS
jgi:hypothetical protein